MCGGVLDLLLFTLNFYCVPLIRSNMGEHVVWGSVSDLLLFTLTFYRVPLIRSNMGEHGVRGSVSDLLLFTLTFYSVPLIQPNMGEHGVWGCFGSFTFHSHFLPRSIGTAESWQNNKDYQMLWEFSQVSI